MGLLSDRQIRALCQTDKPMIEPFVEKQVRAGVISWGLSSYGYDIRVADEFKIFTPNPYNTVVDPKHLDERSLIPFQGEMCIIPPNSFALARTVEYFRIPRSILTITVGKSTYARCFRGDTRIALVDGTAPTLEEMAKHADQSNEMFWGYSIGPNGRIIVTLLEAPRFIGRDSLIEVVLDNGQPIHCTPDHQFVRRDGRMVEAHELRPGDSLMPLYRQPARGYEMVYQPIIGHLYPTHRLVAEWKLLNDPHPQPLSLRARGAKAGTLVSPRLEEGFSMSTAHRAYNNHKVLNIAELPGDHDVYCLTVPEAGNFALEAGVFVHNCGIITNVTPFEPDWEGFVTLEISNTSPLPAKIYANEGIAQVLFFEAEDVCETSYADKKGKYQGQTGVTLPRL